MSQDWFAAHAPSANVDEPAFRSWYAQMSKQHDLNPDPDAPAQFYDYRAAFRANAAPDQTGHWPSTFKKPGHPNEVVGGFNTRTGERVAGTKRASEDELVKLGWDAQTAKRLAAQPEGRDWFSVNAPEPKSSATSTDSVPMRVAKSAGHAVVDTAKTLATASGIPGFVREGPIGAIKDQVGVVKGLLQAQFDQYRKAKQAEADGRTSEMAGHSVAAAIPLLGPMAAHYGEEIAAGRAPEAAGEALVLAGTAALPKIVPNTTRPIFRAPANPVEAAAVRFGQQRAVPIDVGTATGSNFLKTVQEKSANTYGGAGTAEALQAKQVEGLQRVGGELMHEAAPKPTTPVAAGEAVRTALTKQIQDLHQTATTAYDWLRRVEEKSTPDIKWRQGAPAPDLVRLAVDLGPTKKALQPVLARLMKKKELTGQLMGAEGRAAVALDSLVTGPEWAPLSVVDAALGDIKALARGAEMPELRNAGQSIAARAVSELDQQVRARAAQAGPDVLKTLEEGRRATTQKYVVADVLDMLNGEPGQVFKQLTQQKDVALERLKAVQRIAPTEMANVGRAFLEDLFQQATNDGGWTHADKLFADWQRLGAETKKALYPKSGQVDALDRFFLLQKRLKEVKNPSGTARMITATNLLAGIPGWAFSKMLMTPTGAKLLTGALQPARFSTPMAQSFAAAQVAKAAQSAGISLDLIPALSQQSPTAPETRPGRSQ